MQLGPPGDSALENTSRYGDESAYETQGEDEKPNDSDDARSCMLGPTRRSRKRTRASPEKSRKRVKVDSEGFDGSAASGDKNPRYTYADLVASGNQIVDCEPLFVRPVAGCEICQDGSKRQYDMLRHVQSCHLKPRDEGGKGAEVSDPNGSEAIRCPKCGTSFTREDAKKRHVNAGCNGKKRKRRITQYEKSLKEREEEGEAEEGPWKESKHISKIEE